MENKKKNKRKRQKKKATLVPNTAREIVGFVSGTLFPLNVTVGGWSITENI